MFNVNDLVNLKKEVQLRINCYYLMDRQNRSSQYSSTYFLPNDTIRYAEKQDSRITMNSFKTQFTLTANRKDYYLNNVTVLENTPNNITSAFQATSNSNISQQFNGVTTNMSNKFNVIKKSGGGNVVSAYSFINCIRNPATLEVEPGLYAAQFNNNNPYAALIQHAAVPTFFTDNYVSFMMILPKFHQEYKVGMNYQDQQLNSLLESEQLNGTKAAVADSFHNQLDWTRMNVYVQGDYTYESGLITLHASIPITYQDTKYRGRIINDHMTQLPVAPRLYLKYVTGKESFINLSYSYSDTWANIDQVYDGYVMTNYRNFFTNGTLLNEVQSNSYSAAYIFKNTLKIFFFSLNASYTTNANKTINDSRISTMIQQSKLVPFENISYSSQLSGTISKYIFPLQTTIGAKASWSRSLSNALQNGNLLQIWNDSYSANLNFNTKFSSWLNVSYSGSYMTYGNKSVDNALIFNPTSPKVAKWQHDLSANFVFSNNLYCRLSGENYQYHIPGTEDNSFTFVDASCTYKLDKLKTDIELSLTNLAGMDTYRTASLSANSIVESSYRIRPRMALVKFYFRF